MLMTPNQGATEDLSGAARTTFTTAAGALSARDPRVFHSGNRAFCRRLVQTALDQPEVTLARVSLEDQTFQLQFARDAISRPEMADRFAAAVKAALAPGAGAANGSDGDWALLTGIPRESGSSIWAAAYNRPGTLRLSAESGQNGHTPMGPVAERLETIPGIRSCRSLRRGGGLRIRYDASRIDAPVIVAAAARETPSGAAPAEVATGLRRLGYLALAGGSFVLTVVGLAVPGMPTVPFLLVTSYYLVRSSPSLNRRLLRSRFFGPILHDWEERGGLRWSSKRKLILLSLVIFGITLIVFTPPVGVLVVVLIVGAASLYSILKLPEVPEYAALAPA